VSDLSGEIIDSRYQLQKLIATGGMASIYEALDIRLDRSVAVKIMHPHLANDEEYVARFIREAKAAASLSHPNVVAIQDQGWNEGGVPAVFLVMELIDGFTLREYIHEKGALSVKESLRYFSPVISALVAAHKLGIVHRDIKPENILISKDGRVKVADFGLARAATSGATMTIESSTILGSVSYLSPEQVARGVSDARSDVYALGIVLFEMLTGQRPFEGDSPIQIAYKHVNERVPAPSTLKSGIPESIDQIVLKATAPNPDQRYRDASELERDIQKVERELEPAKRQLSLELDVAPIMNSEKKRKKLISTPNESEPVMREKTNSSKGNSSKEIARTKSKKRTSKRVKRNRFIALLIVAALFFGAWNMVGGGAKIAIPSLVGMTEKQASTTLKQLGLSADVSAQIFSEGTKPGLVLSSNPGGGGKVRANGTVHLTLSKGAERITVPDIAGTSVDNATQAIKAAGLIVGTTTHAFSETIAKDSVVNTSPEIGTPLRRSSSVNIIISDGQALGGKSYIGLPSDQALNEISDAGFTVNTSYAYSESVAVGMVISQTLPTSVKVGQKSVVNIVVSQGSAYAYIPQVRGRTLKEATAAIEGLGLKVAKPKIIGTRKNKVVINVSPAEKSKVKPGSLVTLTLG
jgi:serine/threonine-protein kinase